MALTFWDNIGEFTGVMRKLTVSELDGNIHTLHLRVKEFEDAGGKQIDYIEFTGTALIIHYTDSSTDGPFPLPAATMRYVGLWMNDAPYAYLDVVTVAPASAIDPSNAGVYMALVNHTSPASPELFDPEATDETSDENLLWMPLMPVAPFQALQVAEFTGATKSLTIGDANLYHRFTNVSGCTVTVPTNASVAFDLGTEITLRQIGGTITVEPASVAVTINPPHPNQDTATPWVGAVISLKKVAEDEWDYIGPGTEISS